jgi:hypothetical protein
LINVKIRRLQLSTEAFKLRLRVGKLVKDGTLIHLTFAIQVISLKIVHMQVFKITIVEILMDMNFFGATQLM